MAKSASADTEMKYDGKGLFINLLTTSDCLESPLEQVSSLRSEALGAKMSFSVPSRLIFHGTARNCTELQAALDRSGKE